MYGNVQRSSLFVNAVKEFGQGRLHRYVGAGLGLTNANVDGTLIFGIRTMTMAPIKASRTKPLSVLSMRSKSFWVINSSAG